MVNSTGRRVPNSAGKVIAADEKLTRSSSQTGISACSEKPAPTTAQSRSVAKDEGAKRKYRSIASHNTTSPTDLETWRATIHRQVKEGLPKPHRKAADPNEVEIYVPSSFYSSTSLAARSQAHHHQGNLSGYVATNEKTQSESFHEEDGKLVFTPRFTSVTVSPAGLGAGRVDPFASYPIRMTKQEQWLIDQMYTSQHPALKTLREWWLPVAMRQPSTFHQFLANVAFTLSRARGEGPGSAWDRVSFLYYSRAIELLNSQLKDPKLRVTDNVVATVLTFISYSILIEDAQGWRVHLEGLVKAIKSWGGHELVENDLMLSRLLFCIDISGAAQHDIKPRFPQPTRLLEEARKTVIVPPISPDDPSLSPWKLLPLSPEISVVFDDLNRIIQHALSRSRQNQPWKHVNFIVLWIDPIMHGLLSMNSEIDLDDTPSIIQEACRIGIFLFLGEIRRKCGAVCLSNGIYVSKLKHLLTISEGRMNWAPFGNLCLWLLYFGMLESIQQSETEWYAKSINLVRKRLRIESWTYLVASVKGFLWFDDIFDPEIEKVREKTATALLALGKEPILATEA
ncbi:hypothetical protein F5884DRAFT_852089 [Xylogone sp. PMI_703]|nr:hypothetical protein F5884DRAFT_852089 [Xylogone sp. PMI_703]